MNVTVMEQVLVEIRRERQRQYQKWGDQSHLPNGTTEELRFIADQCKAYNDLAADKGMTTWADILEEEVAEAVCEVDESLLEKELVQIAAVTVAWLEKLYVARSKRGS